MKTDISLVTSKDVVFNVLKPKMIPNEKQSDESAEMEIEIEYVSVKSQPLSKRIKQERNV